MEFEFSELAESFKPNIFSILLGKKDEVLKRGIKVYDLFVGTPDFKPSKHIMDAVEKASKNPDNYKYSLRDTVELIEAVKVWYKNRYDVILEDNEIMSLAGSQEGFAHVAWTLCNPGDIVLVPNPGYPVFKDGPVLNGAKTVDYELDPDNHYMPMLEKIPEEIAKKAKIIVVSYPLNPTCTYADASFYEKLVLWAEKYNVVVVHDNAYSEITYDGRKGISFLSIPGAKDVGIEFNSLSKTYNLTGLRISFALGNAKIMNKFRTIRSQFDYGTSYIVQKAAVAALTGPQDDVIENRLQYEERRNALCDGLTAIGWEVPRSEGTMFVWAPIPKGFKDSADFCMQMLENTGVLCTPGAAFGTKGEGHVRFALVLNKNEINEAVEKIGKWLNSRN